MTSLHSAVAEARLIRTGEEGATIQIKPDLNHVNKILNPKYCELPNGMNVSYISEGEPAYFYHDIFETNGGFEANISLGDGDVVFDIGANVGFFSLYLKEKYGKLRTFAFEPAPPLYEVMCLNFLAHDIEGTLVKAGVGAVDEEKTFTYYKHGSGFSTFYPDESDLRSFEQIIDSTSREDEQLHAYLKEHEKELIQYKFQSEEFNCPIRKVSSVIDLYQVGRIDLLKVDAQKAEIEVLQGIEERHWPLIRQLMTEVHIHNDEQRYVIELLESRGFEVVIEEDKVPGELVINTLYATNKNFDPQISGQQDQLVTDYPAEWISEASIRTHLENLLPEQELIHGLKMKFVSAFH